MTTLTVEIDKIQDLTVLQALLTRLELKYTIEEEDWVKDISDAEIAGIKAGLADIEAGRVYSHKEVSDRINQKLQNFRNK